MLRLCIALGHSSRLATRRPLLEAGPSVRSDPLAVLLYQDIDLTYSQLDDVTFIVYKRTVSINLS